MKDNIPRQQYIKQKLFEVSSGPIENSSSGRMWVHTKITEKGVKRISRLLENCAEFTKREAAL